MVVSGGSTAPETYDLLVVGGGINGVGIARDAAGRGLSVLLVEQDDLAAHTSSESSKLIHGGLRYLEYFEFRLVREALIEREVLLRAAPHIIRPLTFVLPHAPGMRPVWMIRIGLFLYDHLGGRERLPGSRGVALGPRTPLGEPLRPEFSRGFTYSDCYVDDARLVVLSAVDAAERGAAIRTRTRCVAARRVDGLWQAELADRDGQSGTVRARALVNATGPWVSRFLQEAARTDTRNRVRLVKGSHIVVPRLYEGDHAYILQNDDRRVVFVIPFEGAFSLIGTTDIPFSGDPAELAISEEEIDYLCRAVGRYFQPPVRREDIVWTYAGVRPLYDDASKDPSAVTRDYVFDLDLAEGAPLLSVFGGKITTFRKLAEHAVARLQKVLGFEAGPWTADAPLPGGDIERADFDGFLAGFRKRFAWLPEALATRLAHAYGRRAEEMLEGATSLADLGQDFGAGLYEREVGYLRDKEWARSAEDVLWRRSKLGLFAGEETALALGEWFAARRHSDRAATAT